MQKLELGEKFFIYLDLHEPHSPVSRFHEGTRTDSIIRLYSYDTISIGDESIVPHYGINQPSPQKNFELLKEFYASITNADMRLNEYITSWRKNGYVSDNTLIIFTSDNGAHGSAPDSFGSEGQFCEWCQDRCGI